MCLPMIDLCVEGKWETMVTSPSVSLCLELTGISQTDVARAKQNHNYLTYLTFPEHITVFRWIDE